MGDLLKALNDLVGPMARNSWIWMTWQLRSNNAAANSGRATRNYPLILPKRSCMTCLANMSCSCNNIGHSALLRTYYDNGLSIELWVFVQYCWSCYVRSLTG